MDRHIKQLENICRICGQKNLTDSRRYEKEDFYNEIGDLYGLELNFDTADIHPPFICGKDANVFYRYRKAKSAGKAYSTDLVPVSFDKHSPTCKLCYEQINTSIPQTKGRPKKAKLLNKDSPQEPPLKKIHISAANQRSESSTSIPSSISLCSHISFDEQCIMCICNRLNNLLSSLQYSEITSVFDHLLTNMFISIKSALAYCLGKSTNRYVREDASSLTMMYMNAQMVSEFKMKEWLNQRDSVVKDFIYGVGCIQKFEVLESGKARVVASAVENVYKLAYPKLVSPFAFVRNVCLYALTGSKQALEINSRTSPSGGYKTVMTWLLDQSGEPQPCPEGDVMNVFDNEQVIGRKNAIKPKNKARISIITNKGFVQLEGDGVLQSKAEFKPSQILKLKEIEVGSSSEKKKQFADIVKDVLLCESELYQKYERLHYEQLFIFIDQAIKIVGDEQRVKADWFEDHIDTSIATEIAKKTTTTCTICGLPNTRFKRICLGCNEKEGLTKGRKDKKDGTNESEAKNSEPKYYKLKFEIDVEGTVRVDCEDNIQQPERYEHIVSNHKESKHLIISDPVYCNPNSFETVAYVLRQIGIENGISRYGGKERQWTNICCDGLPYLICKKLKEEAVVCQQENCEKTFLNKKDFEKHHASIHPDRDEYRYIHEFDWFYLRIGAGHYEMNLVKSYFEMNWIPYMETLCEEMGFTSDAAKSYARNCKDHHKSWHLLLVSHFGMLRELTVPYVRHCLVNEKEMNGKDFLSYLHSSYTDTPIMQYVVNQICKISQGLINFRMAIRRNNADLMHSAKFMTKELFHARNHPKYQEIELYDHLQYLLMPQAVKNQHDQFTSITTSGNRSTGEDFDFILEEKNRQLKQWISKGIPTDQFWQQICRNNTLLEKVKGNAYALLGIDLTAGITKDPDLEMAITAFRVKIRARKYLSDANKLQSLHGKDLDEDLPNFIKEAAIRRCIRLKRNILQEDVEDNIKLANPVPITLEERLELEDVNNLTKNQLEKEIFNYIGKIQDIDMREYYKILFLEKAKGKKKADFIYFLSNVKEALEMDDVAEVVEESEKD